MTWEALPFCGGWLRSMLIEAFFFHLPDQNKNFINMSSQSTRIIVFVAGKGNAKQSECLVLEKLVNLDNSYDTQDSRYVLPCEACVSMLRIAAQATLR